MGALSRSGGQQNVCSWGANCQSPSLDDSNATRVEGHFATRCCYGAWAGLPRGAESAPTVARQVVAAWRAPHWLVLHRRRRSRRHSRDLPDVRTSGDSIRPPNVTSRVSRRTRSRRGLRRLHVGRLCGSGETRSRDAKSCQQKAIIPYERLEHATDLATAAPIRARSRDLDRPTSEARLGCGGLRLADQAHSLLQEALLDRARFKGGALWGRGTVGRSAKVPAAHRLVTTRKLRELVLSPADLPN